MQKNWNLQATGPRMEKNSDIVGGFSPTPLKNMLVKLGSSSPNFGVKIKNL